MGDIAKDSVEDFIARWKGVTASELSTAQSFIADLCRLLGVDIPHPDAEQKYMFERPITFVHGDGSTSSGRIDLYRRGAFVLEAKKLKAPTHTKGFDDAMLRARSQAEQYARALPASEGRPPFLIVIDVGNRIELYSEFSRSGATYTPFPDPRSFRIELDQLRDESARDRLRRVWADPLSLDPSRASARVTRDIAARLATLARSLEQTGHDAETVAQFLMRCLFTMFAEDVKLLPADSFVDLLVKYADQPDVAMRMLAQLWRDMDSGGFSPAIANDVLRFNGKLFKHPDTLPLDRKQIDLLIDAAKKRWEQVEPAIFGTLLERALDPDERHKLGAHYTPRAYVERLVLPTVIEPLRAEWSDVKAAALVQLAEAHAARERGMSQEGLKSPAERAKQANIELRKVRDLILGFHKRLCGVRVLDPACGSGNFLYVTLEHMKRLEGEVLNSLDEFGLTRLGVTEQTDIDVHAARAVAEEAQTVDPHQLLGIELNPRAAAIAEVVLWIGYLQWHYRTRGNVPPAQPVIRDFQNIEHRDAVLAYDDIVFVTDEHGIPVTRWDGKTYKVSPVTGEQIPDDSARVPVERYVNPRKAAWPEADFVVGNPPFIGNKRMRTALGDGYVDALRDGWPDVPESADYVMYWWHHASQLTQLGKLRSFGLITTNSIRQAFNRRVVEAALEAHAPSGGVRRAKRTSSTPILLPIAEGKPNALSLVYAIPDHPWVDSSDGAAVRIAMTSARSGQEIGRLLVVTDERTDEDGASIVGLREQRGRIHADLRIGADVGSAIVLRSNLGLSNRGVIPHGGGMMVTDEQAAEIGLGSVAGLSRHLPRYRNGKDLTQLPRNLRVIDMFGLSAEDVRMRFPAAYQWLLERVKPERDQNPRTSRRENWWLFGENQPKMRASIRLLKRYIATVQTAKHRFFVFLDADILPDDKLIAIGSDNAYLLGVLSSAVHATWALAAGGRLGVGNDPVYNKSRCFEAFAFPVLRDPIRTRIENIAEQLDAHRRRQQSADPDLTITGMYNVLDKLRSGELLTTKERTIHEDGLVSVLRQLHDELDAAVLDAYGWNDLLPLLRVAHGNDAPEAGPAHGVAASSTSGDEPAARSASREDAKRAFDEAILERLVALNAERAAEEARGVVRWLRPDFQNAGAQVVPQQAEIDAGGEETSAASVSGVAAKARPWPKDAIEQVRAVADVLAASAAPLSVDDIAARFTSRGAWKKRMPQLLEMLVALGRAQERQGRYSASS